MGIAYCVQLNSELIISKLITCIVAVAVAKVCEEGIVS